MRKNFLLKIYHKLYDAYGPMHWWPAETAFEVMIGAILTQNTSWKNVEKAIKKLKDEGVLNVEGIYKLRRSKLCRLIKSSGYYRIKAERVKAFVNFLVKYYDGDIKRMKRERLQPLRQKLLEIKGLGPETVDSILLYGLKKPIFVVDAYTRRILLRHGIISERANYGDIQRLFMQNLNRDEKLFNEYHALLVHLGKTLCKKVPKCDICFLKGIEHN